MLAVEVKVFRRYIYWFRQVTQGSWGIMFLFQGYKFSDFSMISDLNITTTPLNIILEIPSLENV